MGGGLQPVIVVVRAVEQKIQETDDLDWKQALLVEVDKKRKEFAKDVAAMANTRGGVIIYGVRDEHERAVELTPILTGERERQRLRALANSHIRPLVAGLDIDALTPAEGEDGILVVSILASPDSPHVVVNATRWACPFATVRTPNGRASTRSNLPIATGSAGRSKRPQP